MTRYKLTIEYEGTNYVGWQKQLGCNSIQEAIEKAIFQISGEQVILTSCGRTDAGVHALGQVAHFDLIKIFMPFQIMMALNHYLRSDPISIIDCETVANDFHSRFDATMRHYQYIVQNRRARIALMRNRAWHVAGKLNISKMRHAATYLIGKHDFSSFRDAECQAKSPIRTLQSIKIAKKDNLIVFTVSARSFLHHMVRNIVGTLIMVGVGKIDPDTIPQILQACDRSKSGVNAPAHGLYFYKADYK